MSDQDSPNLLPPAQERLVGAALHEMFPPGQSTDDPYWVPPEQRLDDDQLDPESVADRDGADLSGVDPEVGDLIDLEAL